MARNGADQIVKKNSKLESFLKRNLDVDTYEKVRAYDSCIVCSEKEDKAFKYIILTDEWLYLTENPPKKVYETVHLKDLLSIELVNDFPSFLQGEEQQNTQHLVIKYLGNDPVKRRKPKSARKAKNEETDTPPRLTTPRSARTNPINPIIRPYSRRSLSARETKEMKLQTARDTLADLRQSETAREQTEFNISEKHVQFGDSTFNVPSPGTNGLKPISPILKRKSFEKSATLSDSHSKGKGKSRKGRSSPDTESLRSFGTGSKLTPRIKGELRLDLSQLHPNSDEDAETEEDEEDEEDENSNKVAKNGDTTGVEVVDESSGGLCGRRKKQSVPVEPEDDDFIITLRDGSTITVDYLMPDAMEDTLNLTNDGQMVRQVVMDVYIMNGRSKILMLIQSAKHNYLIRGTLEEDPRFVLKTTVITPRTVQTTSDKLEYLFRQLKTELQYSSNTMEDNFFHMHELKIAAERNFALRKLFWKTPDVFRFMVRQVRLYIPMVMARMKLCETEEDFRMKRADELEYLVLLLETFTILFRETEIVPTRLLMMKSEGGRATRELITSLLTCPEVPLLSATVSDRIRILHSTSEISLPGTQHEGELHKLLREYKNLTTAVIFELLMIGEQAIWCDSETTLLNVSWVVKHLGDMEAVKPFVEHIIAEAMGVISSRTTEPVSPSGAVLLYHQFHILRTLAYFSSDMTTYIRENYLEEFKYYIQPRMLQVKLPTSYLLRPNIMKHMEWVVSEVLQHPVDLSTITNM